MKQQRPAVIPFFHSKTSVLIPPISAAATLLFWSRRESHPFFQIPQGMPRDRTALGGNSGLTRQDLVEFNMFKAAELRDVVHWDWDLGCPVSHLGDNTQQQRTEGPSKQWDVDWWRIRMCQNVFWKQPRWRLGNVYKRGLLTGLWQGVYFVSSTSPNCHLPSANPDNPLSITRSYPMPTRLPRSCEMPAARTLFRVLSSSFLDQYSCG